MHIAHIFQNEFRTLTHTCDRTRPFASHALLICRNSLRMCECAEFRTFAHVQVQKCVCGVRAGVAETFTHYHS